ncbi:hypothetical protein C8A00DRAFT_32200 [Chaetomidium leptoderma]|uniref:C2H2-type domain-containing protein n=1 Tax=Chaetomidium leptoderma TaxID=669021 RepID=A0AAN6VPP7_9PEZI|nr:hypothetical protein C8A00DRAFT_32200 [Chaetomidium leptoderma]
MDPPGTRKSGQPPQQRGAMGFPSPTQDYAAINPKFVDDCTRMNFAIQQSLPEAVRRIVRDHWEKCLLGSEFHQAFILNASIHHALPTITQRAVRDFGGKMVAESKHELMAHFTAESLDEVADLIIGKASDAFLDKCLEKRLRTIEAKPLINALANAERLGYEQGDVIQDDQHERVIPQEAYPGAAAAANGHHARPSQPAPPPPANPQGGQSQLQCMKCFRTFMHTSAFDHHTRYNVCSQLPPTIHGFEHSCPHCGQGFVVVNDLQAHLGNKACGDFGQQPSVSGGAGRPPRTAPAPQASPATIAPSASQTPTTNGVSKTQPQSTPAHRSVARAAAATPGSAGSSIAADPYGHLTEEQMRKMNDELAGAEEKYAPRFAEAGLILDENLRRIRVEGLRNSFGTKQSMIRKKYGVRLRERRTKAEIQAERERMGLKKAEKEKAKASAGARPPHGSSPSAKADLASRPTGGSGWTAANTPRTNATWGEHDAKRRRTDEGGGYQTPYKSLADETPTRKTLSVSGIGGGLAGSSATAAAHDPTLPPGSQPARVYEQAGARVEIHEPFNTAGEPPTARMEAGSGSGSGSATPSGSDQGGGSGVNGNNTHYPRASSENQPVVIDDDSSSDDDDEDIPSTLPTHVRKSLASGSTTSLLQTP